MRRFFSATILILSIFLSCLSCRDVAYPTKHDLIKTVYIDDRFGDNTDYIAHGLEKWECNTDGMIKFLIIPHYDISDYNKIMDPMGSIVIVKVDGSNAEIKEAEEENAEPDAGFIVGLYIRSDGVNASRILLVDNLIFGEHMYEAIIEHEAGHAMGLSHPKETNSIMYHRIDMGAHRITEYDLKMLCDIYSCDASKFKRVCGQ